MKTYVDERNRLVKLTDIQFDLLPESKQKMLKPFTEPALPEFLKVKTNTNATSESALSQNEFGVSNGEGSSGEIASKGDSKDNRASDTGVSNNKEAAKRGRKPGTKVVSGTKKK
jgi:hypothetical protein